MANERIYIGCRVCKECQYLGKLLGTDWYDMQTIDPDFMTAHNFCSQSTGLTPYSLALMWDNEINEYEMWNPQGSF